MKEWINKKEITIGETVLHLAAFKGESIIIKKLIELGADYTATNFKRMDVIHYAAQNDQSWPIVYFRRQFRMNIDQKDSDGNTPLHLAAHSGAADALSCLLKWTHCVNEANNDGQTPLHLGARIAMSSGTLRCVRLLCFSGADRNLLDKNEKKAIDYLIEGAGNPSCTEDAITELRNILKEPTGCLCLMLRIPFKKIRNSIKLGIIFLVFQLVREFLIDTLAIPRLSCILLGEPNNELFEFYSLITSWALLLFIVIFFFLSAVKDPGIHRRGNKRLLELIESVDFDRICPTCEIVRSPLTRHCVICNKCVERYDHHCPWIDTCVGVKNHNFFLVLLISTFTSSALNVCLGIAASITLLFDTDLKCFENGSGVIPDFVCIKNDPHTNIYCGIPLAALSMILVFCLVFSGALCIVQVVNYCKGKTTNERYGSSRVSARDKGCIGNCIEFCGRTTVPTQSDLLRRFGKGNHTEELNTTNNSLLTGSAKG